MFVFVQENPGKYDACKRETTQVSRFKGISTNSTERDILPGNEKSSY